MPNSLPIKFTNSFLSWGLIFFVSLWSPILHFIRWACTPNEHSYFFFLNQDLADWHYILKSADNHFLSIHDIQADIPIWLRPDAHSLLFFPFILIGKYLSLPSSLLLIFIDFLGGFFCAFATYFFFQTLFNDSKKSLTAFTLVYFTSGITGLIILLRWMGVGDLSLAARGFVGENHSLGYDLMEGNMVHWTTILFRPYYLFPRAFGLLSIALLYKAYRSPNTKILVLSAFCLFIATLIHPQSGLIYGAMVFVLLLIQLTCQTGRFFHRISPALWTISGLILAAVLWKLYQRIPDVDEAVKEYVKRMYNADAVPLFFAIFPMLLPAIFLVLYQTKEKVFFLVLFLIMTIYGIATSEWIIREERIFLRIILLFLSFSGLVVSIVWKRKYLLSLLRSGHLKVFFGFCLLLTVAISLSPHHDGLKVLNHSANLPGALILKPIMNVLSLIYAAPFRLGIAVPLAGFLTTLLWNAPSHFQRISFITTYSFSACSIFFYLFFIISNPSGYLGKNEQQAMLFLKTLAGNTVLCSSESSQFIIQLSQKRTLIGGIAGVLNVSERQEDISKMYHASSPDDLQHYLQKYKIDYIFVSNYERKLGINEPLFFNFPLLYDKDGVKIYHAAQPQSL
ncbi:MAG: hypothetical protein ACUVRP_08680 [Chlorobiales bacterium]